MLQDSAIKPVGSGAGWGQGGGSESWEGAGLNLASGKPWGQLWEGGSRWHSPTAPLAVRA